MNFHYYLCNKCGELLLTSSHSIANNCTVCGNKGLIPCYENMLEGKARLKTLWGAPKPEFFMCTDCPDKFIMLRPFTKKNIVPAYHCLKCGGRNINQVEGSSEDKRNSKWFRIVQYND